MESPRKRRGAGRPKITVGNGVLGMMRHLSRRKRNLAELRSLDSCRLQDIGLSEAARARIVG